MWDVLASAPLDLVAAVLWAMSTDKTNTTLITAMHSVSSYMSIYSFTKFNLGFICCDDRNQACFFRLNRLLRLRRVMHLLVRVRWFSGVLWE